LQFHCGRQAGSTCANDDGGCAGHEYEINFASLLVTLIYACGSILNKTRKAGTGKLWRLDEADADHGGDNLRK
jgi:hypothetical protein